MQDTDMLTIGDVAARAGVNTETLRYYERRGVVGAPPRTQANYRLYPANTVQLVRFVKRAQALGFALEEIKELLLFRAGGAGTCADVRGQAVAKIADIDGKIRSLSAMRDALSELVAQCSRNGPLRGCPILESLEPSEDS